MLNRSSRYWLFVALWMSVVFLLSTDFGSANHTSRILGPLLHWLVPGISDADVGFVQFLVRKSAHLTEYAVLGLLALGAAKATLRVPVRAWSWRAAGLALLIVAAFASLDEFHQSFVPTRTASAGDVLIDTCGGVVGLTLAFLWVGTRLILARRSQPSK